jgi:nucleoside-diphosphate-sugar epimerase
VTILVTGGTGFLGSYFTRHAVLERGERVVVLDRYIDRGRIQDVLDQIVLIEGDVGDTDVVEAVMREHRIDRVAHFAFILGGPAPGRMAPYVRVQCLGVANVYEAARVAGVRRVVFCSSIGAYGPQAASPLTEDLLPNPNSLYGASKVWAESLGRHYREHLGLEVVNLRFGSTYGLGRAWRGSYNSGLLTTRPRTHYMASVEDAVRGQPVELPPDETLADWTYAADGAQAVWLALTAPRPSYDLYNICSEIRPIGDFRRALQELLPDVVIRVKADGGGEVYPPMDNTRLRADLGFRPQFTIEAGVRDYIARVRAYDEYLQRQA